MNYNNETHISTIKDVESFFDFLLQERNVSFHPDDDFADYVSIETGEPIFNKDETSTFNRLMGEAFDVCELNGVDIYSIGCDRFWEAVKCR